MFDLFGMQYSTSLQYSESKHRRHDNLMFFEKTSASVVESHMRNRINQLFDTYFQFLRTQVLLNFLLSLFLLLFFLCLWFFLFLLCLDSTFFLSFYLCVFFGFLTNLNLRNDSFALRIKTIHILFSIHAFSDFIYSSIDHINERLQRIFIKRVNFRQI